ncbi:branched-chain amino acid transport system II carrier protein, partial [Bacillus pumilus]
SFYISNFGLAHIIAFSVPVLTAIYPLAIVIIVLSLSDKWIGQRRPVYVLTLILTGCVSLFDGLVAAKLPIGPVEDLFQTILPLYDLGIGWVVPAIFGVVIGFILSLFTSSASQKREKQAS